LYIRVSSLPFRFGLFELRGVYCGGSLLQYDAFMSYGYIFLGQKNKVSVDSNVGSRQYSEVSHKIWILLLHLSSDRLEGLMTRDLLQMGWLSLAITVLGMADEAVGPLALLHLRDTGRAALDQFQHTMIGVSKGIREEG
jgi:hypothetical protein